MHLRLTEDDFATLIDMVSLAGEVASINQKPGSEDQQAAFADLEDRILERAKSQGYGDIIEIDAETGKHRVTASYQEESYVQDCIDEMRNEIFWDELSYRLAERDVVRKLGENSYLSLPEEKKIELISPIQKNHWENFVKDGLNHIHKIAPHGLG